MTFIIILGTPNAKHNVNHTTEPRLGYLSQKYTFNFDTITVYFD